MSHIKVDGTEALSTIVGNDAEKSDVDTLLGVSTSETVTGSEDKFKEHSEAEAMSIQKNSRPEEQLIEGGIIEVKDLLQDCVN